MQQKLLLLFCFFSIGIVNGQQIELYTQFNGQYDYTAIGNTLNVEENEASFNCTILDQSSASLNLNPNQTVKAAYLYWAGSGNGDFDVSLNNQQIQAERTFSYTLDFYRSFFAAFADVTNLVNAEGNGLYTFSDIDLQEAIESYHCQTGTNFGGWAIIIVYEEESLPINQVNIFDGLQAVSINNTSLTINLNLNVIDNQDAKIGFLAWEGDQLLAVQETLQVNGNIISNPPLNPADNAFNGTNSFTGATNLYNMDLDVYNIENNINIGDTSAEIKLTSGDGVQQSDFVMVNNIVTVLNSKLPNPSPEISNVETNCNSREILVDYTVYNTNATDTLPANTLISFYVNSTFLEEAYTQNAIPVDGFENGQIMLAIPASIPDNFELQMQVNLDQQNNPIINEIDPEDNFASQNIQLTIPTIANTLLDIKKCDDASNDGSAMWDFSENMQLAIGNQENVEVSFHLSEADAENNSNPIAPITNFQNTEIPQIIYVRVTSTLDPNCYQIESFLLDLFYLPQVNTPQNLIYCDSPENNGIANFDLTAIIPELIGNQNNLSVSFYLSVEELESDSFIENPTNFQNTANPQTVYLKVFNSENPLCYDTTSVELKVEPIEIFSLEGLLACDKGLDTATFDLTEIEESLNLSANEEIVAYYTNSQDAGLNENPIVFPTAFENQTNPQSIFIRKENPETASCYQLVQFPLKIENCPPFIPDGFSPNKDGINDVFEISGLYDIFENFNLKIYARYGNLIYEGNNNIPPWDGTSTQGLTNTGKNLPTGTYYYILNLNDPNYQLIKGWVYLNR